MKQNSKLKQLQDRFPDKQINRLVSCRSHSPLTLHQKLVLSFLMYRCRKEGKPIRASISKLSRLSGMHRDTISRALCVLEGYKLVTSKGDRWLSSIEGRELHPEWFGWIKDGRKINDLAYHYFVQPAETSPLSITDSLILLSDQKKVRLLSARFQISENTVRKSIRKLETLTFSLEWFADVIHKPKSFRPDPKQEFLSNYSGAEKTLVLKMIKEKISQSEIEKCFQSLRNRFAGEETYFNTIYKLIGDGDSSFDKIMKVHREKGKDGTNGLGLLYYKLGMTESA